jgi:sigma-B regulation protein RsbU (phosphoserine phosphatase)
MFEQMKANARLTVIKPGELLFLHTDGVTEAEDGGQNDFGENRLHALLADGDIVADAAHCVARVGAAVQEFARDVPQFDDITCLALRR